MQMAVVVIQMTKLLPLLRSSMVMVTTMLITMELVELVELMELIELWGGSSQVRLRSWTFLHHAEKF